MTRSLRFRVTIAVFLPLFAILGLFMVMQYMIQQKLLMQNMTLLASQTASTIENSLRMAMLNHNQQQLQDILDSISQNDMLQDIYLMNPSGKIVFSPNGKLVGALFSNTDPTCQGCHRVPAAQRPLSTVVTLSGGQRVFRSMNPIHNKPECQNCHPSTQRLIGVLLTDISIAPLESSLKVDLWQHFILWGAAILVAALVVNVVVDRFMLRRLDALSNAIKKLGLGQLSSPLPENHPDEIGQVSLAFNEMAQQIKLREGENTQLSEDLQRRNQERSELIRRLITAQEDERKRFARELHDEMGQALTVLALQTELAHQSVLTNPDQALQVLKQTKNLVSETSEQMYNMILALRPSVLDDLGLAAAIRSLMQRMMNDTGIACSIDSSRFNGRLPSDLEIALYRVFQEALTNILRHARAHTVSVLLAQEDGCFIGEISDDGQGFNLDMAAGNPNQPHGLGLYGMRERIMQQNGQFEISSEPGNGTKIKIRVPITEANDG